MFPTCRVVFSSGLTWPPSPLNPPTPTHPGPATGLGTAPVLRKRCQAKSTPPFGIYENHPVLTGTATRYQDQSDTRILGDQTAAGKWDGKGMFLGPVPAYSGFNSQNKKENRGCYVQA